MKYTDDEAFASVLEKGKELKSNRARRKRQLLSGCSCVLFALLAAALILLPDKSVLSPPGTVYGSFLLSLEAGGYILVGVLAFAFGVSLTLLCLHVRKSKNEKQSADKDKNEN